jgi:hypothetical protein
MMYGRGKSDSAIVVAKLVNKAGRLAAEVERRAGPKGRRHSETRAGHRTGKACPRPRLRRSMRSNHDPTRGTFTLSPAHPALAPMINRRRKVRSPLFEVPPSFCFPPVDRCNGVSPQPGREVALIAAAVTQPMPGTVLSRLASPSSSARRAISASSTATLSPTRTGRISSGNECD